MTLQQMKCFVAVADSGSISEAAKRLFAAQSSVWGAVQAVESHYGITAFLRSPKGVTLTGEGKELLIEFKGILNRLYYLDERYEGRKENNHGLYVSAQHHICGMDSFVSILKSVEAEEYHVGFQESGLADLGIIFLAEQSKGQMMQELRGRCSAIHGCVRGLADKVSLYRREYQ